MRRKGRKLVEAENERMWGLRFEKNLTLTQIAQRFGMTQDNVAKRLQKHAKDNGLVYERKHKTAEI